MDPAHIRDLFAAFGAVEVRRLFGGAGIYADGVMFALISGGQIYLKTDDTLTPAFAAEGCRAFEYGAKGNRRAINSFWQMPDRLYDDADELAAWARRSFVVARQKAAAKATKRASTKAAKKPKKKRG
jgi:DNA transformation protein